MKNLEFAQKLAELGQQCHGDKLPRGPAALQIDPVGHLGVVVENSALQSVRTLQWPDEWGFRFHGVYKFLARYHIFPFYAEQRIEPGKFAHFFASFLFQCNFCTKGLLSS